MLFQRELKLAKAQKQTKIDNESLFQREMKLEKVQKQTKIDNESLFQREMKLTKVQKQTKIDNESVFQREMKLWQDKKDLCKERKTFDAFRSRSMREARKGKEEEVMQLQKEISKE